MDGDRLVEVEEAWASTGTLLSRTPTPRLEVQRISESLYVLTSSAIEDLTTFSGGNTAVFLTPTGVVIVDTKLASWGDDLVEGIHSITDRPVTTIINTHCHGDHTGNNHRFGSGPAIVAHEQTKANMARREQFRGAGAKFLPNKTYREQMTIGEGESRIDLYYFGVGHTNGDAWVAFPDERVLMTGEMFAWKDAPLCDKPSGGNPWLFPGTLSRGVDLLSGIDVVVPAHSPVTSWRDLEEYRRFNEELLIEAEDASRFGRTAEEAAAATVLRRRYPTYNLLRLKAAFQGFLEEPPVDPTS